MGLLRSIIHGFGFELGAQAARKAVQEAEEHLSSEEQQPVAEEGVLQRLRRRWADRARARAEARAKNKRRTAVEQQLRALKKKNKEKSR
jgi:hypothetical protein